jgi:hypothetical protein
VISTALCLAALLAAEPDEVPPVPLLSAAAVLQAPGGEATEVPLRRDGESQVEPASSFRVAAGAPLADARLALYDAQEALVPSEEQAEIGSAASRFALSPARPLRPGGRYTLRLEGAAGREIHDLSGAAYRPLSSALLAAGEAPAEPPARRKPRKRPASP